MTDDEPALEKHGWIYVGRVITSDNKLGSRWIDHLGTQRVYAATAHGKVIGGIYEIESTADAKQAVIKKSGNAFTVNNDIDEAKLAQWRLEDRAAYLEDEGRKAERRLAKENDDIGNMTLAELRHLTAMASPMQRAGMKVAAFRYLGF